MLILWIIYKNSVQNCLSYILHTNSLYSCHIPNSETCQKHVWLQYNIKFLQLFGLICAQNSVSSLVLYNRLNSTKSLWLFCFIWVKICSHIHLCLLPNYLLQTQQIYLDFMQSFPLSKSELLYSVSLMKHLLVEHKKINEQIILVNFKRP